MILFKYAQTKLHRNTTIEVFNIIDMFMKSLFT